MVSKIVQKNHEECKSKNTIEIYAIMFLVTGIPLSIGAIVGYIVPDTFKLVDLWLMLAVGVIGISIALYINVSKRFIIYEGTTPSD